MRQAGVFYKREAAGLLTQLDDGRPAISLILPKNQLEYESEDLYLFLRKELEDKFISTAAFFFISPIF